MSYPNVSDFTGLIEHLKLYAALAHEHGAEGVEALLDDARASLTEAARQLQELPDDAELSSREPDALSDILAARPAGPRRISNAVPEDYSDRLAGAFLARSAGCTLGAGVEGWSIEGMKNLARELGTPYPPVDYWEYLPDPYQLRYSFSPRFEYTRPALNGIPVDDDLTYTILGLLIVEDHGPSFTVKEVADAWQRYLPYAATAERVALDNLRNGVSASAAAVVDNPYREWIGADIRSDPWGYMAPGWPERAAEMAYHDAYISHRRTGIYGEMYFSAAVAAAFAVDDPVEALRIGLSEIPADCGLARAVRWALEEAPRIRTYRDARDAVDERFPGMSPVHTTNNACLTIWGITIGGTDITKVIGETVAMGMDNDCTAATAGSIVGAVVGKGGLSEHWYEPFGDLMETYIVGHPRLSISDVLARFEAQARRVH